MRESKSNISSGLGVPSVLTIIFIVLKCLGIINWSWWWVLSPVWISWAIVLFVVLIIFIIKRFKKK